ncbi:MAG: glutathione S-transferase family protein [Deltaproteobacteria bacterium]|nr:glutathione S-transferase family protein [Deltaproteobacteria bacterium]
MATTTLYQFALCPFCNKVRAGLELKGVPFEEVEVSPRSKVELPALPEGAPAKVPVLAAGDEVLWDSTTILSALDAAFPGTRRLLPADETSRSEAIAMEQWVDEHFIQSLPPVLYGTWGEAAQASKVIAEHSRFGTGQGMMVKLGGPFIMHAVAKRILKRNGRTDAHGWVSDNLDHFEQELGDQDFVCGDQLTIADAAMHGAITCIKPFPIFESVQARPRLVAWFERVQAMKGPQVEA